MPKYFEIKNKTEKSLDLYFYGDIVSSEDAKFSNDDKCPKEIIEAVNNANRRDLNIYINSGGGGVFAGIAIYNVLKRAKERKNVFVDGLAGSIASVIMFCGDTLTIPENAYCMIHKPFCGVIGNSEDMKETAQTLEKIEETILKIYLEHAKEGVSRDDIKNLMAGKGSWLSGHECAKYFDIILAPENKAVAYVKSDFEIPEDIAPDKIQNDLKPVRADTLLAETNLRLLKLRYINKE